MILKDWFGLALILCLAALIRVVSFAGYFGSDDGAYSELAYQMANQNFEIGKVVGAKVFPLRVGLIGPVALGFRIAGPNEFVMILYPFFLSMISVVVAFFAARAFFNARAGLIAALIQAILPIDARAASQLLPDLPAAFWAVAGILLLHQGSHVHQIASRGVLGCLAGLAFGLSWLSKESIVYLVPFVSVYLVWLIGLDRRNLALCAGTALVAATTLITESLVYYYATNDFLYRFHETEQNYETASKWFFPEESKDGWGSGDYRLWLIKRTLRDGPAAIFLTHNFGMVTVVALIALVYAAFRKLRPFLLPGIWFISLILMFNFASSTFESYRPLTPLAGRYLYLILFPAVILTAGFIDVLAGRGSALQDELERERRFWGAVLSVGVLFMCLWGIYGNVKGGVRSPVERRVARMLSPSDPVYTDRRTVSVLKFFWKYPNVIRTVDFERMRNVQVPRNVYILINHDRGDFLNRGYGYVLPEFYEHPPKEWLVKWKGHRAELFWVP